ncbi:hypothetical protein GCM10027277_34350 [Pseudoduganella ginsengisoli]
MSAWAENTPVRSYAVLSLAGDALALHVHRHQVGSRTESAPREVNAIDDPVFDQAAVIAARAAFLRLHPGAKLQLMTTQDRGLYLAQNSMFERAEAHEEDRAYLKKLLKELGVTHALVITKFRSVPELKLVNTTVGSGYLEGLGFYIDDMIETRNLKDQTSSRGMVVPFAYLRVRLIDAETLSVLKEAMSKQSFIITRPSADSSGMETFLNMPSGEKTGHIRQVLEDAIASTVQNVAAEPPISVERDRKN